MPYWRRQTDRRYDGAARSLMFGCTVLGVVVVELYALAKLLG